MREKRIEIDALNILFCLIVVFVHVVSEAVGGLQRDSWQLFFVYIPWRGAQFVVQGFLFLSALKLFYKQAEGAKPKYVSFMKGRLYSIAAPYAAWVLIYYLYFVGIGYFGFTVKDYLGYLFLGNIAAPFYFIILILQFYMLQPLWSLIMKKVPVPLFLLFSAAVTLLRPPFPYSDRVFTTYLLYWALGCAAGANLASFTALLRRFRMPLCAMFLVLYSASTGESGGHECATPDGTWAG
jgi:hypothetical protein